MNRPDSVIIIGGGIIGCSIAYGLAVKGVRVTVLDKGALCAEASTAAAGMLGAQVETHQPGPFYELCKASQRMYPEWANELQEISGISLQYIGKGILRVALTEEDEAELKSRLPWMDGAEWLTAAQTCEIEPALSEAVRGGIYFAQDHQVHPLYVARALKSALLKLGSSIREWTPVLRLIIEGNRVVGVKTTDGDLYAEQIVLSAGAWSPSLLEPLAFKLPSFPVKGQCISVRTETSLISSTVFAKGCYIVPRLDGTLTIGATQEEIGFNKKTSLSAVSLLHQKASAIVPSLSEVEFVSTWAGLRPGTPDGLPYIGQLSDAPGLTIATGHFRNGILLAPITGQLVTELLTGQPLSIGLEPYSPERNP
jgi:glycine oxidase